MQRSGPLRRFGIVGDPGESFRRRGRIRSVYRIMLAASEDEMERGKSETHDEDVFAGTEVKGLNLRSVLEDRQEQAGVSHSAEVGSIVRPWILIRWAQMRAEEE